MGINYSVKAALVNNLLLMPPDDAEGLALKTFPGQAKREIPPWPQSASWAE